MPRPRRVDRRTVASSTLTLRLAEPEKVALDQLVAARTAELAGEGVGEMTVAAVLRWLIRKEAQARGIGIPRSAKTPVAKRRRK